MQSKRIKVAYILTSVIFGGVEKVSLNFLESVDRRHYHIEPILFVKSMGEENYFARKLRDYGFKFQTIPTRRKPGKRDSLRVPRTVYKLYSNLNMSSFDIVHSHGYFADICSLPIARFMGIKSISTCHGFVPNTFKLAMYYSLDRAALRLSNRIVCVSDDIRKLLLDSGLRENKIMVVPNAVAIEQNRSKNDKIRKEIRKKFSAEDKHLVIGYAGRLSEEKGLMTLMQAFSLLVQHKPECRLWLVGEGPLRTNLQVIADNSRISDRVSFFGFRDDVNELMKGMDVFVMPSFTEGTPLALLEAMSLGIPAIASSVGQIPQIIKSGENGLLISPGQTQELYYAILQILDDKEFAWLISENAVKTIKNKYSVDAWVRKIENIYSEVYLYR